MAFLKNGLTNFHPEQDTEGAKIRKSVCNNDNCHIRNNS